MNYPLKSNVWLEHKLHYQKNIHDKQIKTKWFTQRDLRTSGTGTGRKFKNVGLGKGWFI